MREPQFSFVLETPAAKPDDAARHFQSKLTLETDAWDLKTDIERGRSDFVVIDTRSPAEFEARRIAGAINLPYPSMTGETTAHLPKDKVTVASCNSPASNPSTRGALHLE